MQLNDFENIDRHNVRSPAKASFLYKISTPGHSDSQLKSMQGAMPRPEPDNLNLPVTAPSPKNFNSFSKQIS